MIEKRRMEREDLGSEKIKRKKIKRGMQESNLITNDNECLINFRYLGTYLY